MATRILQNIKLQYVIKTEEEKCRSQELPVLIEISKSNGMKVDCVIGDTAYSGTANPELANEEKIQLISRLYPCISQGCRRGGDCFDYNKDTGMYVCPAGHMAVRRMKESGKKEKKMPR
ncbi:MAG: hypothetical protein LBL33_02910 [Tannerella sp.]|jgi:hypothetical protein|nr:hypothetical protein [Tannerella sp.]